MVAVVAGSDGGLHPCYQYMHILQMVPAAAGHAVRYAESMAVTAIPLYKFPLVCPHVVQDECVKHLQQLAAPCRMPRTAWT